MKMLSLIISLFVICACFNGCLKDVELKKYTYYVPVYSLKSDVRANIKSSAAQAISLPGRIYVQGNYIYINEVGKGIHIVDYSQPSSPQNVAYIPIPGNQNLAVQGNYLYADEYADLLTIDITNPLAAKLVSVTPGTFTENNNGSGDTDYITSSWRRIDTMVKGNDPIIDYYPYPVYAPGIEDAASVPQSYNGGSIGGSMAQFTVLNDRLYTVSTHYLNVFNIDKPALPSFVKAVYTNGGATETIYPFENNLFLGAGNAMYIYDATDKDNPVEIGDFGHVHVCDPVIAEPDIAYVTLRSGTACNSDINELDVLNTTDLTNPVLIKSYPFTNPRGLAKDGDNLFVCDGTDGLKILDAADVSNMTQIKIVSGFEANDVILNNGIAIVTAVQGLYLIDYSNISNASVVGKININK